MKFYKLIYCFNVNWSIKIYSEFFFFYSYCSIKKLSFSLKVFLNDHFKYCFLVIKFFAPTLHIGFSVNLRNIALLRILKFCFLFFFSTSLCKFILNLIYGPKNCSYLNSNILWISFYWKPKFKLSFKFWL